MALNIVDHKLEFARREWGNSESYDRSAVTIAEGFCEGRYLSKLEIKELLFQGTMKFQSLDHFRQFCEIINSVAAVSVFSIPSHGMDHPLRALRTISWLKCLEVYISELKALERKDLEGCSARLWAILASNSQSPQCNI
ncbi:hypothetical protein HK098_005222 [Nowakowskiella sp. JEL0407]|nr:hypothetical protein HK098_005222 [Nowakowskiella sp. JEL0407]